MMNDAWHWQMTHRHALAAEDLVKLVFQSRHGVGHLVRDEAQATRYVAQEMAEAAEGPLDPLVEPLGGDWFRLNLRPARRDGLHPEWIARMMALSPETNADRAETQAACMALAEAAGFDVQAVSAAAAPLTADAAWLPGHSAGYREAERPAYRVLHRQWLRLLPVLVRLVAMEGAGPVLIALDGRSAAGKTTFAQTLSRVTAAPVVHTDDYVIPHAQKTAERLSQPGGNCDVNRLRRDVLRPFMRGEAMQPQRYDCHTDCLLPPDTLSPADTLILEGAYSLLPVLIDGMNTIRLFMNVSSEEQQRRIAARDGAAGLEASLHRWIPLEEAYFKAFDLPCKAEILLQTF